MPTKFIKLASKFKSDLKAQMREYEDLDTPLGQLESARRRGYKTAAEARKADYDEVFGYIERAKTPQQALKRSREMFPDQSYSVSTAIQYAGGPKKAFKKIDPVEKSKGGMLIKGLKKLAGKEKKKSRNKKSTAELRNKATKDFFEKANSSRPDLEAKAKRKKKMEAERPAIPTMRKDMKRNPVKKAKGGMVTKWEQKWG